MVLLVVPAMNGAGQLGAVAGADVESAVARISALGNVGAYEARQLLLRGVPFALAADAERARGTAMELAALGMQAVALDDDAWSQPVPLFTVRSFRVFPEGIEVTTRPTARVPASTHPVRWDDVEMIVPARSVQSTVVHSEKKTTSVRPGINPLKMVRTKTDRDHRHEDGEERFTIVSVRAPDVLLRFDLHGLDYTGLGDRRQPVARANYELVVAALKEGARAAVVDDRLEKLAARMAGAPSTSTASSGGTMVKKTERAFTDDNEGAVVAAARLFCLVARARRSPTAR